MNIKYLKNEIYRNLLEAKVNLSLQKLKTIDPRSPTAQKEIMALFWECEYLGRAIYRTQPWYVQLFWAPTYIWQRIRANVLWWRMVWTYCVTEYRKRKS